MSSKPRVHFLHLRKTGGSALWAALAPVELAGDFRIVLHPPPHSLEQVPEGEAWFISVRDPLSRFVSGFYSRKDKGGPGEPRPWNTDEELVYGTFETANDLAEALSSDNSERRECAIWSLGVIRHFRPYWDCLGGPKLVQERIDDLFMVLRQESLTTGFRLLTESLAVQATLPVNDIVAHRNTASHDRSLSCAAKENLRLWLAADFDFVDFVQDLDIYRAG